MAACKNTISQRQSRARRKDYISSLESRIQDFEQKGVQATKEIQVAAQKVVEENRKLKVFLAELGVSEAEVRGAITTNETVRGHEKERWQGLKRKRDVLDGERKCSHCGRNVDVESYQQNASMTSATYARPPISPPDSQSHHHPEQQPTNAEGLERIHPRSRQYSDSSSTPTAFSPATQAPIEVPPSLHAMTRDQYPPAQVLAPQCSPKSPTTMSCTSAASIIASMRNSSDATPNELLLELGCRDAVDCDVTNLKVMEVMER